MSGNFLSHNGPRRALAFLLTLALLMGSLGITGISTNTVYAAESEGYVTVRIEAGELGETVEGAADPTRTVLEETVVDLSKLSSQKAIEAVEAALQENNLEAPSKDGYGMHNSFGGVYAPEYHFWCFMLNDKSASLGLDGQSIVDGDSIVLFLQSYDSSPTYSYFVEDSTSHYNDYFLYATARLILQEYIPEERSYNLRMN